MPERKVSPDLPFDLVVIGGGINGAGIVRDAALRGLRAALVEQADLCHGTTRWSSRLIHGGLRYLEHFEFSLVRESLRERETLLRNAPHLVAPLPLLVPLYRGARRGPGKVRAGMWLYDLLSADKSLPSHRMLDVAATLDEAPGLRSEGLLGAARYADAQVAYPERLTVENALDAEAAGAVLLTYHRADRLLTAAGQVCGLRVVDARGHARELVTGIVINAAGPWVDQVLTGLGVSAGPFMGGTRGTHIVVARFDGAPASGCYVEAASDGRPFFILPWLGRLLIGTTDIRHDGDPDEARADGAEIDYLLAETNRVFPQAALGAGDIQFHYTGVRPLPRQDRRSAGAITRRHLLERHRGVARGLYSVIGGKLTTYRSLAEETLDGVLRDADLSAAGCSTTTASLPGAREFDGVREALPRSSSLPPTSVAHLLSVYGSRARDIDALAATDAALAEPICPHTGAIAAEVIHAFEQERARTLADVLFRRCMAGLSPDLGRAAMQAALEKAAPVLGWDAARIEEERGHYEAEVERFTAGRG